MIGQIPTILNAIVQVIAMTDRRRQPRDLVGHSINEYRHLPCGQCGQAGTKVVDVVTDESDGYAKVVLACGECGYGNRWTGHIKQRFF